MKYFKIKFLIVIYLIITLFLNIAYSQDEIEKPDYSEETIREREKRYGNECFIEELQVREGYLKCRGIFDGHTEGMEKELLTIDLLQDDYGAV